MRTIHADLQTAQESLSSTSYIDLYIGGTQYSSKIIAIKHKQLPFQEQAIIWLDNSDRTFDSVDLRGFEFFIGYGYVCSGSVNRFLGDGLTAGVNPSMPSLWVKEQDIISVMGKSVCVLTATGMWDKLRDLQILMSAVNTVISFPETGYTPCIETDLTKQVVDDGAEIGALVGYDNNLRKWFLTTASTVAGGSLVQLTLGTGTGTTEYDSALRTVDYSYSFGGVQTIKDIIVIVLNEAGMTLNATIQDDGIIDTFKPFFATNVVDMPSLASMLVNSSVNNIGLLQMTKGYLKPEANNVHKFVFPQDSDLVNQTYYSYQSPYFKDFINKSNLTVPNSIIVYWGANPITYQWDTPETQAYLDLPGTATDAESIAAYEEIIQVFFAPEIGNLTDANKRAEALLARYKAEKESGTVTLPFHDCSVELFDKIKIIDARSTPPNYYKKAIGATEPFEDNWMTQRALARASDGKLWQVNASNYLAESSGLTHIYASYSTDNGLTWTEELVTDTALIGLAQESSCLSIVIDSTDNPHVIIMNDWNNDPSPVMTITHYKRESGTWTGEIAGSWTYLTPDYTWQLVGAQAVIDSTDIIHVLVSNYRYSDYRPNYLEYIYGSWGSWSAKEIVREVGDYAYEAAPIAVLSTGVPVVLCYNDYVDTIEFNSREGGTWNNVVLLDSVVGSELPYDAAKVAVDLNDNIHVIWLHSSNGVRHLYYKKRTGSTWGDTIDAVSDNIYHFNNYDITVDTDDNAYIVYNTTNNNPTSILFKKITNGVVGKETLVSISFLDENGDAYPTYLSSVLYHRYPSSGILDASMYLPWVISIDEVDWFGTYGLYFSTPPPPIISTKRVTTITHTFNRGVYTMELGFGTLTGENIPIQPAKQLPLYTPQISSGISQEFKDAVSKAPKITIDPVYTVPGLSPLTPQAPGLSPFVTHSITPMQPTPPTLDVNFKPIKPVKPARTRQWWEIFNIKDIWK